MGEKERERYVVEEALTVTKSPVSIFAGSEYRFVLVVGESAPQRVRCTALQHHEAATREYS